ncbi:hypothetical protein WH87_10210 [Devosia epidermidihirudinis]|uniref:Multi-ubiquitin domain-containing protein n=1 Tax=Devosia epidermidihirudinis TaxID=1293439 RepID=A0A0F5QAH8_9HYPH|nr:multiubiquitin domain-containing protein [Devosia epidermidihirudinis]KKC38002.1 hypothetical protein WH87_10210 [Devosia epidermidihirudinis]
MSIDDLTTTAAAKPTRFHVTIDGKPHVFDDPIVNGLQLLEATRQFPADEFLVFQKLVNGQLEDIRLDEAVDLREPGREDFITFRSDASFRLTVDGRKFDWGRPIITGLELKRLAGVDPASYGVWLAQRVGDDKLIPNEQSVDLRGEGVERFFTGIDTTTEGSGGVLPPDDAAFLNEHGVNFEEVDQAGNKAVIIKSYPLPAGRFDTSSADILVLLPPGYPDCAPDMFFLSPWVRLAADKKYPRAADQPFSFAGGNWQRWSRHNSDWRPGVDGIWTMLRRIGRALEIAA